jgi:hypothetical protein
MTTRDELFRQAEHEYDALTKAVEGLREDELSRVWIGRWGGREILAHITGWHQERVRTLERLARGQAPDADVAYDDFHAWNDRFVEARKGRTSAAIVEELAGSHRALMAAAARLSDAQLAEGQPARAMLTGVSVDHYREHAEQIRQWRTLRALNARFITNFVTNDVASHDALLHEDFLCLTSAGVREHRAPYLTRWATAFDPEVIQYWDYRDEVISLVGPVALVRAVTRHVIVKDGAATTGMTMYTDTYVQDRGEWKCVQAQLTRVSPEHFPPDATIEQSWVRGKRQEPPARR